MDNLTHSIAGIALAEAALHARRGSPGTKRRLKRLFWGTSLAANNLPDFDFLLAPLTKGRVGYLLHHRGYTHTVLMAIPQALVILAGVWIYTQLRSRKLRAIDWGWLALLSLSGGVLHIAMDGMNSYGVHPFWPLANRWFYGDFMFILEPWLWACLLPPLIFAERKKGWRMTLALIFFGGLAVEWAAPVAPWYVALLVTGTGLAVWFAIARLTPILRLATGVGAALAVTVLFALVGAHNRAAIEGRNTDGFAFDDIVLSPLPSNLFCWTVLTVESNQEYYRVRKGMFATLPRLIPADKCPVFRVGHGLAPLAEVSEPPDPHVSWFGEYRAPLAELRNLYHANCGIAALFRFARAPFVLAKGGEYVAGDLRYDFSRGMSFAESEVAKSDACPERVPPWTPPREKLLGGD
jgi:inner membrane protein